MEELRKTLENEVNSFKQYQKEYDALRNRRQVLSGQLSETEVVQGELDFLKETDEVYKLVGPVLMKQNLFEAKSNVAKRVSFIKGEMNRTGNALGIAEGKFKESREKLYKIQETIRQKEGQLNK